MMNYLITLPSIFMAIIPQVATNGLCIGSATPTHIAPARRVLKSHTNTACRLPIEQL